MFHVFDVLSRHSSSASRDRHTEPNTILRRVEISVLRNDLAREAWRVSKNYSNISTQQLRVDSYVALSC